MWKGPFSWLRCLEALGSLGQQTVPPLPRASLLSRSPSICVSLTLLLTGPCPGPSRCGHAHDACCRRSFPCVCRSCTGLRLDLATAQRPAGLPAAVQHLPHTPSLPGGVRSSSVLHSSVPYGWRREDSDCQGLLPCAHMDFLPRGACSPEGGGPDSLWEHGWWHLCVSTGTLGTSRLASLGSLSAPQLPSAPWAVFLLEAGALCCLGGSAGLCSQQDLAPPGREGVGVSLGWPRTSPPQSASTLKDTPPEVALFSVLEEALPWTHL